MSYRINGRRQGMLCEDEVDNLDEDRDKMRIYKDGYATGRLVTRVATSFGGM